MSRSRVALAVLFFATLLVPHAPAQAGSTVLCTGYSSCSGKGYSHGGYASHRGTSYWNMYTGTNCTNYVAYRLVSTNGLPNRRPAPGVGNARDWGRAMSSVTDSTPTAGSVAWWGKTGNHVAYVEKVVSSTEILVSESNWSGSFDWRRITRTGSGWPDGFIHFSDPRIVNETRPAILGQAAVGTTLKASGGVWTPKGNTYAYQWLADGRSVAGATTRYFTPGYAQLSKDLTVSVTATRPGYPTTKAVSRRVEVAPGTFVNPQPPRITGTPRVDSALTAQPGSWSPAASAYTYQWLADGAKVEGATSASLSPGPELVGRRLSVRVRAAKGGYTAMSSTSPATSDVAAGALSSTSKPTVTGTPKVGSRLSASTGTWTKSGLTHSFQWFADGERIDGATGSTYVPQPTDLGHTLTVHVTARRTGYTTAAAGSLPTAAVARGTLAVKARPTVSGTPRVGSPLTAGTGTWSPTADFTFQWFANDEPLRGATRQTFTPTHRERGLKIRVRVTARRDGYTTVTAASVNTAVVAAGRIRVTTPPTVTGVPRLGKVLTISGGAHDPAGATLRYQWLRDGQVLSGATGSTRRVTANDLGHRLSARVTLKATGYASTTVTTARSDVARAASTLSTSASRPGAGRVTFSVRIAAPGVAAPGGTVTVRHSSTLTKTVAVTNGRATIALTGLAAGERTFRFSYSGTRTVAGTTYSRTLSVG